MRRKERRSMERKKREKKRRKEKKRKGKEGKFIDDMEEVKSRRTIQIEDANCLYAIFFSLL